LATATEEKSARQYWSVRTRLLLLNSLVILALAAVSAIAWRAISVQSRAMAELTLVSKGARYHQDAESQKEALRGDVHALLSGIARPQAERDELLDSLAGHAKDLRLDLITLAKLDLPADLSDTETRVQTIADAFLGSATEIGRVARQDPAAARQLLEPFGTALAALAEVMEQQTLVFAQHIVAANKAAEAAESDAKTWLVTALALVSAALIALIGWLARTIRTSLRSVRDVAQALAGGDLAARVEQAGSDELGELGRAINGMATNINDLIDRLRADAERDAFGSKLVEALEMADSESDAYRVIGRALSEISHEMPAELLLADSSRAHLEQAVTHPEAGGSHCSVTSPFSCMAVRRGGTVAFEDSEALNACRHLKDRPCGSVSAVCVPISFMGRALGVLHTTAAVGQQPNEQQVAQLTTLGQQAGSRIGTLRAFHSTQQKAVTDGLTGLNNRRTAEESAHQLIQSGKPFAVVLADLDHFKKLNDERGHDAGDQALRVFSDVVRSTLRDQDVAARWGGEEFVLLLPDVAADKALEIVGRLQRKLAMTLLAGGVPSFTCSFGIADSSMSTRLEQLLKIADTALYSAKEQGRDRGVIGGVFNPDVTEERAKFEHPAAPNVHWIATEG
jgi:diguanylate cyclase (GGDEF)-like protein